MGVNAQNVAATQDGRQVNEKFTALGVEYEVTEVETPKCKIIGVASGATEITVVSDNIKPDDGVKDIFKLEGGLNNQFATAEDLEIIKAPEDSPMAIPADAFAADVYTSAILVIPENDAAYQAYAKATGWSKFLAKTGATFDDQGNLLSQTVVGDANGDGEVNARDVNLYKQLSANFIEEGDDEFSWALDLNGDGSINARDVNLAKQISSQMFDFELE
jgi:hypothetical protein